MTSTAAATVDDMRTLLVAPDPAWLAERRRLGHDRRDEVWDGVLHVPPDPTTDHQRLESRLIEVLGPLARRRGLEAIAELSILDPADHNRNYRTPDVLVVDPQLLIRRGTEGPVELVIEILSNGDESRDKLPFYAARGVKEVWLADPDTREVELYVLRGATYFAILPDRSGLLRSPAMDLELSVASGPKLRLSWLDGSAEI